MSDATTKAKELLAEAQLDPAAWKRVRGMADDTLAVAITLAEVAIWAARGPCLCHPANKKMGAECLKDAADAALTKWEKLLEKVVT